MLNFAGKQAERDLLQPQQLQGPDHAGLDLLGRFLPGQVRGQRHNLGHHAQAIAQAEFLQGPANPFLALAIGGRGVDHARRRLRARRE